MNLIHVVTLRLFSWIYRQVLSAHIVQCVVLCAAVGTVGTLYLLRKYPESVGTCTINWNSQVSDAASRQVGRKGEDQGDLRRVPAEFYFLGVRASTRLKLTDGLALGTRIWVRFPKLPSCSRGTCLASRFTAEVLDYCQQNADSGGSLPLAVVENHFRQRYLDEVHVRSASAAAAIRVLIVVVYVPGCVC